MSMPTHDARSPGWFRKVFGIMLPILMLMTEGVSGEVPGPRPSQSPRPVFSTTLGLSFVHVPAGAFMMGDSEDVAKRPQLHPVTLRAFYVARECITGGQFEAFIADGHPQHEAVILAMIQHIRWNRGSFELLHTPVPAIPYACAEEFAAWLTRKEGRRFEIISEAEHERVLRSGKEEFPWMKGFGTPIKCNWMSDGEREETSPMEYPPGEMFARNTLGWFPNPWLTWTRTKPYQYPTGPETDPVGGLLPSKDRMTRWGNTTFRTAMSVDRGAALMLVSPVLPQDLVPAAAPARTPIPSVPATIASPLQAQTLTLAGGVPLRLYCIPAQSCTVGRPKQKNSFSKDAPTTQVLIPQDYWLGATEVTQAQYVAVTGATNPSYWKGDDLPVHNVTMQDILRFCDRLTEQERAAGRLGAQEEYRLPTEAEWECAARAGSDARWVCGDDPATLGEYAWVDQPDGPKPVGRLRPNAWGFQDMAGNVLELTINLFEPYSGIACRDGWQYTYGGRPGFFAARGGSWRMGPLAAQTTLRRGHMVLGHTDFVGFRLACGPRNPTYVYGDADYRKMPPVEYPKERRDRRSRGTGLETLQADQSSPPATRSAP